jgi:hypothetical protein
LLPSDQKVGDAAAKRQQAPGTRRHQGSLRTGMFGLPTARTTSRCCFPADASRTGRIVKVAGLKSPFDIVIDDQNRVEPPSLLTHRVVDCLSNLTLVSSFLTRV